MQPVSLKHVNGREIWKQEIWVMYVKNSKLKVVIPSVTQLKIISAWRYPGVSPKRNPIPEEILRELEEGSIIEPYEDVSC